jgi:dTDP-4-amino-4,6-dideoxygalactose transaminase
MQKAYTNMEIMPEALPLARDLASEVLSLPIGPQLEVQVVQSSIIPVIAECAQ